MDFNFFENDIVYQILNMNLNKLVWKKNSSKIFSKIFLEYFLNISSKAITSQKLGGCGLCYPVYTLMNVMLLYCIEIAMFCSIINLNEKFMRKFFSQELMIAIKIIYP
jgi:hypothetical protein